MSLLEDVFLQDEANEAQELERIIEGDEFEERPRSDSDDNSEKEDEAEEDKRRVDPTATKNKRIIKNPRFVLNPARLTGPRGIRVIPDHFKDFKFKGKGHEREDLDLVLKKLEHWAYRLYPKFQFEDCLKKIETLGKKRPVMVYLIKIRSDQYLSEETVEQIDTSDEEVERDEFDMLLQEQIELTRLNTPGPVKTNQENGSLIMLKATSSPSISNEQRERMLRNRKLAEERRSARLKNQSVIDNDNTQSHQEPTTSNVSNIDKLDNIKIDKMVEHDIKITMVRHQVLDGKESSDEDKALTVNESVRADIHNTVQNNNNIEENSTNNAEDDNYDVDKENHQGQEILQNNRRFDESNDDIEENLTSNAKDDNYDLDKENHQGQEILQNNQRFDESNDDIEENLTSNAKDDNYDVDKENHQGQEILQNNQRFDESNDDIEENLTSNAKDDNYDVDKENHQGQEILQNNQRFDESNDDIEENLTSNAKDDNYDVDKENHQGQEILQNNQRFDESNDDIEENLTSNAKNDICDKTSEILTICSNNGNKSIENEINGAETMSSNIQESTNKDEVPDQALEIFIFTKF
ncbi:protein PFC0760c [Melitaea cinxia]|uniref:protein PFC0760c n=1 Tax=Melitaea cinxia TaxID=113334 RepID=UPI001E271293|nr:protein PFC0760c [Melitaea cinxia]